MKIAYNPKTANALTAAPANNDITFDLRGLNIFVRGEKFKGTDTTYSVFKKHTSEGKGGYDGLVPVPSYSTVNNRYLREDGKWAIPTTVYSQLTNQDLNTLMSEGSWYFAGGGNTVTNKPSGVDAFELYVGRNAIGYRYLKIISHTSLVWFRYHDSTKWQSWIRWFTDANTDLKVLQSLNTSSNYRPLVLGYTESSSPSNLGATTTLLVYTTTSIYAQPSTGTIWANKIYSGGKLVITEHQSLANYVTLNTILTITGAKTFIGNNLKVSGNSALYSIISSVNSTIPESHRDHEWKIYHSNGANASRGISIWSYGTNVRNHVLSISAYLQGSKVDNPGIGTNSLYMEGVIQATSNISAAGFIKSGSSNDYVLLGAGGHKKLSDIADSHTHPYLPLAGGTMHSEATITTPNARAKKGGGDWAFSLFLVNNASGTTMSRFGVFGKDADISYTYIGTGSYNSNNVLKINPTGTIQCNGYIKNGSSDLYVLLGGGSHKALSDFSTSGHNHDNLYWKVNNRTTRGTGDIYLEMWRGTNASWKLLNSQGTLYFLNNFTDKVGEYFNVFQLSYNTGHAVLKGNLTAHQLVRKAISVSWYNGRNSAVLRDSTSEGYHTLWSLKTANGSWDFGEYNEPGWVNIPVLSYITDSNFNTGNNTATYQIKFPLASGTIALIQDLPNVTNYYWANVKVSSTSSTSTSPTFATATANVQLITSKVHSTNRLTLNATNAGLYLKFNNDDTKSVILNGAAFKPFDAANVRIDLGSTSGRWRNLFAQTGNFTSTITSSGFIKSGSSNSYVLLGGGDHKAISDFVLKSEAISVNVTTITKTLTVTLAWMDTGITGPNLPSTGTYIVQIYVPGNDGTANMWSVYNSGIMSWYREGTNTLLADEIMLHRAGHAYQHVIYLRTIGLANGIMKLLISADINIGKAYNYTFKFKRVI